MFEILGYSFVQKAFLAGLLVSVATSVLGVVLVQKRLSLLGDGLAHAVFGGIAIGLLFGIEPLIAGLVFAILAALGIDRIVDKLKSQGDAAIAVILSAGMALAITIIGYVKGFNVNLFSYLFGSILSISETDLVLLALLALVVILTIFFLRKKIILTILNKDIALLNGVNVRIVEIAVLVVSAISVVLAVRAVGVLLITGLIVIPALTALRFSSSFNRAFVNSAVVSAGSVILGLLLALLFDLPPSGTIVLSLVVVFIVASIVKN